MLSYSHNDMECAENLILLFKKLGFEVWYDKNMPGGINWNAEIDAKIKSADFVILLLSEHSAQSKYVQYEINSAFQQGKKILPLNIDSTKDMPDTWKKVQNVPWDCHSDNVADIILFLGNVDNFYSVKSQWGEVEQTLSIHIAGIIKYLEYIEMLYVNGDDIVISIPNEAFFTNELEDKISKVLTSLFPEYTVTVLSRKK